MKTIQDIFNMALILSSREGTITTSNYMLHVRNDISHLMQYENDMDSFLTYMPFISVAIVAGLFIMALLNFSTLRKSMQRQSEQ
jgi:hypothetical protein